MKNSSLHLVRSLVNVDASAKARRHERSRPSVQEVRQLKVLCPPKVSPSASKINHSLLWLIETDVEEEPGAISLFVSLRGSGLNGLSISLSVTGLNFPSPAREVGAPAAFRFHRGLPLLYCYKELRDYVSYNCA